MSIPEKTKRWIEQVLNDSMVSSTSVTGGCINQTFQIELQTGDRFFVKYNAGAAIFDAEVAGLNAINKWVDNFAPRAIASQDDCLILEWLQPETATISFWQALGEKLAQMHECQQPVFGFEMDNFCGKTPQPNPKTSHGIEFFADHRIRYQAMLALQSKKLTSSLFGDIETLCLKLDQWIPDQPPVLIHGDLWSGNVMNTQVGARIVDPAAYYGWAEADMAMTTLFGGFEPAFYQAYESRRQILPDWRQRADLYNLYHLLNHLNLFGGHYLQSVEQVIRRYV